MKKSIAVRVNHVFKTYQLDSVAVPSLIDVSVDIAADRFTVISGPSGSGKTTLLNMIGCIDRPDSGEIHIDGQAISSLSDDSLSDFRAQHLGYIFQTFNLLPVLSAFENVEYPLLMAGVPAARRRDKVRSLLKEVGLEHHAHHRPGQLSGGQRQRVAIARALVYGPALVLADEPTANLDSQNGTAIIGLMRQLQRSFQVSFIFSSHDPKVLDAADDVIHLCDGRIVNAMLPAMEASA
jgi:putative ABC transport system ATP-binding protein